MENSASEAAEEAWVAPSPLRSSRCFANLRATTLDETTTCLPTQASTILAPHDKQIQLNPNCILLFLSAVSEDPEVAARMLSLNGDVHIEVKPVLLPHLVSTVEGLLSRHAVSASLQRSVADAKH